MMWIKNEEGNLINLNNTDIIRVEGKEKKNKKNIHVSADYEIIKSFKTKIEAKKLIEFLFNKLGNINKDDENLYEYDFSKEKEE